MLKAIKRYQIRAHLGKGSMADVYEAYDPHTDRMLAIKILREDRQENHEYLRRFFREAKAVGSLSHSNIVAIYDIDEMDKRPFIVMEHLKGIALSELIKSGRRFTFDEIITIGIQLAMALDYAHGQGIIHRDIKPSNIIILSSNFKVKITDFGIAHFEDPEISLKTRIGDMLGTPQYMSPEQIQGTSVDGRADLFSVGVVLYQLLTGERPFSGDTIPTLMYRITTMEPKPMNLGPEVPKAMRHIVQKLLQKNPENRFQSGNELAAALKQAQQRKYREPRILHHISEIDRHKQRKSYLKTFSIIAFVVIVATGLFFSANRLITTAPDPGRISGTVLNGEAKNAEIDIYALTSTAAGNGTTSSPVKIAGTKTDTNGVFTLPLFVKSQPLMVVLHPPGRDQDYTLSSVLNYREGEEIGGNISVFSHIGSALALYKLSQGEAAEQAVDSANHLMADFVQIDDVLSAKLINITPNSMRSPSSDDKFSVINNGLDQLLQRNNQSGDRFDNLYSFADLLFKDVVFDGKLNGIGEKGALHFGARAFSIKYFREGLANAIMDLAKAYGADFVMNDFYKIALLVNDNTSPLFDGGPSSQLKESPSAKLIAIQLDKIESIRKKFAKDNVAATPDGPSNVSQAPPRNSANTPKAKNATTKTTIKAADKTPIINGSAQAAASVVKISGTVNLGGFLQDAAIQISSLRGHGNPPHVLATTITNASGVFSAPVEINSDEDTIMVAAFGGQYRELLTGKTVALKPEQLALSAIVSAGEAEVTEVNLTFFSHVTSALTRYLIKTGKSPRDAFDLAYQRIRNLLGFEFQKTVPATVFTKNEHNGFITPELAYGMFNAAIANLTVDLSHASEIPPHTRFTTAAFADVAYRDIYRDGQLNGVDATGRIDFGPEPVSAELYRNHLAQSFLSVAQSNLNNTGLRFDQFFAVASAYNQSSDELFAKAPVTSISSEGPLITKLNPGKESTLSGVVKISASVNDVTGIQRATFWLDNTFLGNARNPLTPALSFNSRRFPSGLHRLRISVLNKEGKESALTHYVYLENKLKDTGFISDLQNR